MNILYIILQASSLTEGAKKLAQSDPHGFTLSLISVSVVFLALLILYLAFSLVGKISTSLDAPKKAEQKQGKKAEPKRGKKAAKAKQIDAEVAAAIAMALEAENSNEIPVAICTALALHFGYGVHDYEPEIITIKRSPSAWDSPALRFRKNPQK